VGAREVQREGKRLLRSGQRSNGSDPSALDEREQLLERGEEWSEAVASLIAKRRAIHPRRAYHDSAFELSDVRTTLGS
jgi:hypothetical protein